VWKPKIDNVGLMVHISLKTPSMERWYFYNGCSRHMTGFKDLLNVKNLCTNNYVMFGNGTKGKILGSRSLISNESPNLDNVLWVRGLTSNLISISQLCEQGMNVIFKNSKCLVTKENGEVLMRGIKTKEKCYEWSSQLERKKGQETRKLQIMLEHHQPSKMSNLSHYDNIDIWKNNSSMGSLLINKQISQQYSVNLVEMNIVSTKDQFAVTFGRMLDIKLFEKPKDKSGISQQKELQQLLYNIRDTSFCASLLSLCTCRKVQVRILGFVSLLGFKLLIDCLENALK